MSDHYKGAILVGIIFAIVSVVFGLYHGYGAIKGAIDGLLLYAFAVFFGWLFGQFRRLTR